MKQLFPKGPLCARPFAKYTVMTETVLVFSVLGLCAVKERNLSPDSKAEMVRVVVG